VLLDHGAPRSPAHSALRQPERDRQPGRSGGQLTAGVGCGGLDPPAVARRVYPTGNTRGQQIRLGKRDERPIEVRKFSIGIYCAHSERPLPEGRTPGHLVTVAEGRDHDAAFLDYRVN